MKLSKIKFIFLISIVLGGIVLNTNFIQLNDENQKDLYLYSDCNNRTDNTLNSINNSFENFNNNFQTKNSIIGIWQEGQTIKTSTNYPRSYIISEEISAGQSNNNNYDWGIGWNGLSYSAYNDGLSSVIYCTGSACTSVYLDWDISLYAKSSGIFYYEFKGQSITNVETSNGDLMSGTFNIDSDYIDLYGYIHLMGRVWFSASSDNIYLTLNVLNSTYEIESIDSDTTSITACTSATKISMQADYFYFIPDDIISYPRSEYRIVSDNVIEHKLEVENPDYNTEITIDIPESLEFASITPSATTSTSGNELTISNTIATSYEIFFTETTNNYQFCIEDVSNLYLQDVGFEGSWNNDFSELSTNVFDDVSLNSTVIKKGSNSLRIEDTDGSTDQIHSLINDGYYYVSFSIFIETLSGTFRFYYYDGSWFSYTISTSNTDIWLNFNYYIHIDGTSGSGSDERNIAFDISSGQGVWFLDEFRLFHVKHHIKTIDYEKVIFSGQLIDWETGIGINNQQIDLELYDRCADTSIETISLQTNNEGYWNWIVNTSIYLELQDFREIMINSTSNSCSFSYTNSSVSNYNSQYSTDFSFFYEDFPSYPKNNEWDFSEGVAEYWDGHSSYFSTEDITNGYWYGKGSSVDDYVIIDYDDILSIDASVYTILQLRFWCNISFSDSAEEIEVQDSGTAVGVYEQSVSANTWYEIEIDLSQDNDWSGTETDLQLRFYADSWSGDFEFRVDFIGLFHRNSPTLTLTDTYGYCRSDNNTLQYRIEIDSTLQNYINDLEEFNLDQEIGNHTVNATVFNDINRYLPYIPYSLSLTNYIISFSASISSFDLTDNYVNIYLTASNDFNYYIYENDTTSTIASGTGDKDGTAISHSKDNTYGSFIYLYYKFNDSSGSSVWFNTSYTVADYTKMITYVGTPILVDGRVSISITTNLGDSQVYIDDDSKAGVEVDWENEGVFSWYSNTVGENNITIQVRNDCDDDGYYLSDGETFSDLVSYHLYDEDLNLRWADFHPFTDEGATFTFESNYRGSATTEFRCKTQDDLEFSQWLSEDNFNGTYYFTFVNCDLDTTYNFTVEIRAFITDESADYQYIYLRYEYTPYSPDPIVQNPQGINPQPSEEVPLVPQYDTKSETSVSFYRIIFLLIFFSIFIICVSLVGMFLFLSYYFTRIDENEAFMDWFTRKTTESTEKGVSRVKSFIIKQTPGLEET